MAVPEREDELVMLNAFLRDAAAGHLDGVAERAAAASGLAAKEPEQLEKRERLSDAAAGKRLVELEEQLRFLSLELVSVGRNVEQASAPTRPERGRATPQRAGATNRGEALR
jgi:DNA-binding ferritin-like protein